MTEPASQARPLRANDELRESRLRERLATLLAAEIVSGRLEAGHVFPSAEEIVEQFEVSRTVARETVQTLSMLGLVHVQHGKRTEVLPESAWDILSPVVQEAVRREGVGGRYAGALYEFRLIIEPPAAALAAKRADEQTIAELEALAAQMGQLAETRAAPELAMQADRDFHEIVARASENRIVVAVSRDIDEVLATLWTLSQLGPDEVAFAADQHARIADALARRDAPGAEAAMREHLEWAFRADIDDPATEA